jgi:tetratricopeptide (TPR) repeat protein
VCAAALGFWRDGQRAAALGLLADAAAGDPLHAEVQYLYGLVLLDSGRAGAALAAFRRCAYVDPAFAPAHLGLAVVFAQSGQRRRSVAALDTATRLVDGLDPAAGVGVGAGLRVGEIRELIAAQRLLLDPVGASAGIGGRR